MIRTSGYARSITGSAEEQAAAWFARHRSGAMKPAEWADWKDWLAASPAHGQAFAAVQSTWQNFDLVRAHPDLVALHEAAFRRGRSRKWWKAIGGGGALAASVALVIIGMPMIGPTKSHLYLHASVRIKAPSSIEAFQTQELRTAVGERRAIMLADGSTVTLDTDTVIRVVKLTGTRLLVLSKGRAFFQVAKDASHPFIVFAGDKRIMAVGTAFDVELGKGHVDVVLRAGKVRVETAPRHLADNARTRSDYVTAADLVPGTHLRMPRKAGWTLAKADVPKDLSWLDGQLVFDQKPLGEVVSDMNRYSLKKIVLRDSSLSTIPVSGVFAAGQPEALADALEAYKLAHVAGRSRDTIILTKP